MYTFVSQFDDGEDRSDAEISPPHATDVNFLRGLNLEGLMAAGAGDSPLQRLMISSAAAVAYNEDNMPTPATLIADLKATANFKSAIADLNDDGGGGVLPYLGYQIFDCADEVHEDEKEQYLFRTPEEMAEDGTCDVTARSRAQLAALKQYALKGRVYFVLLHTDRREHAEFFGDSDASSDVLLMALGVSPATRNLVGVIATQVCKGLCG